MGRTFLSVRIGVRSLAERWARAAKHQSRDDRGPAAELARLAKTHSSAAFFGCDDPLEAALFSAFLELHRKLDEENGDVDP